MRKNRVYRFGDFFLDADEHFLLHGQKPIPLSPRSFDLLVKLVENAGHLLDKETLIKEVWADAEVEEGNLNRTISNLRKALGEKPNENRFIETIPRIGYRFVSPVTESVKGEDADQPIKSTTEEKNLKIAVRPWREKWLVPVLLSVLILSAAFAFLAWRNRQSASALKSNERNSYEPIRLTYNPDDDSHPRWTGDGRIRFFRTDSSRRTASLIMNADGTDQTEVRAFENLKYGVWSPDGGKIIFAKPNDKTSYYLANADGTNEIALPFYAGNFDWSPDGKQIVYQKTLEANNSEIFLYSIQTGESKNLTNNPSFDADPSFSPDGKLIVFAGSRDGNTEIYSIKSDGGGLMRLTFNLSNDSHPVFSPDGTQIAFTSDRDNESADVYLMSAAGDGAQGGARKLTDWKTNETVEPGCWSPDGTRIAFFSDHNGRDDIYLTSAEVFRPQLILSDSERNLGSGVFSSDGKRVAYQAESGDKQGELRVFDFDTRGNRVLAKIENADLAPAWSPDGQWIAFQNLVEGNTEIFLVKTDGSSLINLTQNPAKDISPAWSPDGRQIVFTSNRNGPTQLFQLHLMNSADGSSQRRIYYSGAISASPSWAPEGREIAFTNDKEDNRTGNFEIFLIEPENSEAEKRLTFRRGFDIQPSFSPDGKRIAFVSQSDGNSEIYVMDRNGENLLRLTRNQAEDVAPHWSPEGKTIIFSSNRNPKFALYQIEVPENGSESVPNSAGKP